MMKLVMYNCVICLLHQCNKKFTKSYNQMCTHINMSYFKYFVPSKCCSLLSHVFLHIFNRFR